MTFLHAKKRLIAFTLIELLVVIAILGVLASLIAPSLINAKNKGAQVVCMNNLRQLQLAMTMYVDANKDCFPVGGTRWDYASVDEDWIWWQQVRDIKKSAIVPYLGAFRAALFTCPIHKKARQLQGLGMLAGDPYRYSYSMTSFQLDKHGNPGLGSIITSSNESYLFRLSQVRNPSNKIMLIEEGEEGLDDGRWLPGDYVSDKVGYGARNDPLTERHSHKGNVIFADGHAALVDRAFARNLSNSLPMLE